MKKIIKQILAFAITIGVIGGLAFFNFSEYVNAQGEEKPSLTIENTTPFEVKNVKVQLNKGQTVEIGTIGKKESVEVPLEQGTNPIVQTKIRGKMPLAGKFDSTVIGWVKENSRIQLHLDDELKVYVSSNIEDK